MTHSSAHWVELNQLLPLSLDSISKAWPLGNLSRGLLFKQKDHHGDIIGIPNEIVKKIPARPDTRSPCDEIHFSVPSVPSMKSSLKTNQTTDKSRRLFFNPSTQPSPDLRHPK